MVDLVDGGNTYTGTQTTVGSTGKGDSSVFCSWIIRSVDGDFHSIGKR